MGWLMPAEKYTALWSEKRTRRLPSDSTGRQYESETERQASIARQAEIREAVLAYQASCQTTYPEVNIDDHSALDRWWASVSRREKQKLAGAIRREKKRAKEWLAKHEAELPHEDDGRDSTNIQPYKYFHRHDTRDLGVDDNLNDQDGVDFAQQSDKLEPSEHKDMGTIREEEAARAYFGLTSTLDIADSGELSGASKTTSGTLRSSWSRIEKTLGNCYNSNGKRKQWRSERQTPPLHVFRHVTKMAYDEKTGEFYPVTFAEFNPYDAEALESMRRRIGNKSKLHQPGFGDMNEMMPGRRLSYPTGPVRDWSGDKNDEGYQMWLQSGNYEGLVAFRKSLTKG